MPMMADASVDQKFESIVGNVLGGAQSHAARPVIIPLVMESMMIVAMTAGVSPIRFKIARVFLVVLCQTSSPRDLRLRYSSALFLMLDVEHSSFELVVELRFSVSRGCFSISVPDVVAPVL